MKKKIYLIFAFLVASFSVSAQYNRGSIDVWPYPVQNAFNFSYYNYVYLGMGNTGFQMTIYSMCREGSFSGNPGSHDYLVVETDAGRFEAPCVQISQPHYPYSTIVEDKFQVYTTGSSWIPGDPGGMHWFVGCVLTFNVYRPMSGSDLTFIQIEWQTN